MPPRVFLTTPPLNMAETPLQYHRPLAPLGIAYLGAMLEDRYSGGAWSQYVEKRVQGKVAHPYASCGVVRALDNMRLSFYGQYSYERLRSQIADHATGAKEDELFIGLSVLSDGMHDARRMLIKLRREFPRAKIVVGGPHATFFPDDFYSVPERREGPLADFVVRNEGELAILGIVEGKFDTPADLERNAHRYGINPHACTYHDDYRVIDGGQYAAPAAGFGAHVLDALPPPAYFLFEDESGSLPYEPDRRYGLQAPAANINSSRGCPHKCTFCTIPMLVPGYRTLSAQRILQLMEFLSVQYGVQSIFFREDNFIYEGGTIAGSRWNDVEDFCKELKKRLPDMKWAIEARADNLVQPTPSGPSRIAHLADAGLTGIYVGVESASDAMLKLYVKGSTVNTMSEAIQACGSHNVAVVTTVCYGDPDIFLRRDYPLIDDADDHYKFNLI
ncbi:MAG: radical SAM protein, partial [Fimbriimonadaceae bacterium]